MSGRAKRGDPTCAAGPRGAKLRVTEAAYVRADRQRRGLGRALLVDLIDRAARAGFRSMIAGISADQAASLRLHAGHGFAVVARLAQVGFKHGRWLDLIYMQRLLATPD